jgi:hypothetical protein
MGKYKIDPYFGSMEKLCKRADLAKARADQWLSLHQEAYDFAMPDRESYRTKTEGSKRNRHIYDSTAIEGLEIFSNKIQHGFFPDWMDWLQFESGHLVKEDEKVALDKKLEIGTNAFFSEFHQSNHSMEINPALKDWGIGTFTMEVDEGRLDVQESMFHFKYIPLAEVYPEEPPYGRIKSSWREHKMEAGNIKQNWKDADISQELAQMIENKPTTKITLLNGQIHNPEDNTYHQIIIWKTRKQLLFTQSFKTQRRITCRASVTAGELFGRGAIIRKLADIRTLNKVKEFTLNNGALQMAGVYTGVDDGIFNPDTVRIAPGNVIPVGSNNASNPTLTPLARAGDIGLGQIIIENLQAGINLALFAQPLGDIKDPVKSASEQIIRHQDDLKRSGTSFGRLFTEYIQPMTKACLDILQSRSDFPKFKVDGKIVKIKLVSPLAKQKELEDFQNSQLWYENVRQLPEEIGMASAKLEELPRYWASKLGVPMTLIREPAELKELAPIVMQSAMDRLKGGGGGNAQSKI